MQIVIDIPEETYKGIMLGKWFGNSLAFYIQEGTPLPKGHGRLIDEKDLSLTTVHLIDGILICDAPTIIPEDKEAENDD